MWHVCVWVSWVGGWAGVEDTGMGVSTAGQEEQTREALVCGSCLLFSLSVGLKTTAAAPYSRQSPSQGPGQGVGGNGWLAGLFT